MLNRWTLWSLNKQNGQSDCCELWPKSLTQFAWCVKHFLSLSTLSLVMSLNRQISSSSWQNGHRNEESQSISKRYWDTDTTWYNLIMLCFYVCVIMSHPVWQCVLGSSTQPTQIKPGSIQSRPPLCDIQWCDDVGTPACSAQSHTWIWSAPISRADHSDVHTHKKYPVNM